MNVNVSIFLNVFVSESVKIVWLRQNRHKAIHLHPLVWDRQTDRQLHGFVRKDHRNKYEIYAYYLIFLYSSKGKKGLLP